MVVGWGGGVVLCSSLYTVHSTSVATFQSQRKKERKKISTCGLILTKHSATNICVYNLLSKSYLANNN